MQLAAFALAALAAGAAPAPAPLPDTPVGAFLPDYTHSDVGADACQSKDPGHVTCTIPAKTMGRYLVTVVGKSTATGPSPTQAMAIGGVGWGCGQAASKKGAWTTGGTRTFLAQCVLTVLTDAPCTGPGRFRAGADVDARTPAGPVMTVKKIPWSGVLTAEGFQAGVATPKAAGGDR